MTFRLGLRRQVASCQSSEQEVQERRKNELVFKIELNKSVEGLCGAAPGDDTGSELIMQKVSPSPCSYVLNHSVLISPFTCLFSFYT